MENQMPKNNPQEWTLITSHMMLWIKIGEHQYGWGGTREQGELICDCVNALANRNPDALEGLVEALKSIDIYPEEPTDDLNDGSVWCEVTVRDIKRIRTALANFNKPRE